MNIKFTTKTSGVLAILILLFCWLLGLLITFGVCYLGAWLILFLVPTLSITTIALAKLMFLVVIIIKLIKSLI